MQQSESIKELATALAKAQAQIEGATKGKVNPAFKSKYADLSSVWEACREALTKNGLSVVQAPGELIEGRLSLTTMLLHSSGEFLSQTLTIPLTKVDAQGYGSATTYARRYALAAMVGVSPEDDDGNAASERAPQRQQEVPADRIDGEQLAVLQTLANQSAADLKGFCTYYKISALPELPSGKYAHAKAILEKKLAEKQAAPVREAA